VKVVVLVLQQEAEITRTPGMERSAWGRVVVVWVKGEGGIVSWHLRVGGPIEVVVR